MYTQAGGGRWLYSAGGCGRKKLFEGGTEDRLQSRRTRGEKMDAAEDTELQNESELVNSATSVM